MQRGTQRAFGTRGTLSLSWSAHRCFQTTQQPPDTHTDAHRISSPDAHTCTLHLLPRPTHTCTLHLLTTTHMHTASPPLNHTHAHSISSPEPHTCSVHVCGSGEEMQC